MIRATIEDYDTIYAICNDPFIRKHLSPEIEIDPAKWLEDPRNIILHEDGNAMLFLWRWVGVYEAHILFRARGAEAFKLAPKSMDKIFEMGATIVRAVIHQDLKHVSWFVRRHGFAFQGMVETVEGPCGMYQLEASQWA